MVMDVWRVIRRNRFHANISILILNLEFSEVFLSLYQQRNVHIRKRYSVANSHLDVFSIPCMFGVVRVSIDSGCFLIGIDAVRRVRG